MCVKSLQSCLTLCYPTDCSPPGSSVCGIPQARMLEWVAIPFSRGSSWPRDWTCVSYISCIGRQVFFFFFFFLPLVTPGLVRAIPYPETDLYIIFQIQTLELPPPGSFPGLLMEPLLLCSLAHLGFSSVFSSCLVLWADFSETELPECGTCRHMGGNIYHGVCVPLQMTSVMNVRPSSNEVLGNHGGF